MKEVFFPDKTRRTVQWARKEESQAGNQTKDIVKLLKVSRAMVQKTVKRFKEVGFTADRPGKGRKRSAQMEQNKKKLREMI
ncbi:hypothetical protein WR25_15093 [Diploscapter pachys]|uniref:Paired domain-containing protein n=1 Tax=Diploscapter pachys TaxID=2018661 RepID=A0A2A2KFK0_9BILA|nr:hypothetical protein WR25_15093 [Diploscapter pachys]